MSAPSLVEVSKAPQRALRLGGRRSPSPGPRDGWLFVAVCAYLAAQAFTLPVFPFGPSWALWPGLPDFAAGLLALAWLPTAATAMPPRIRVERRVLGYAFLLCAANYVLFTLLMPHLDLPPRGASEGVVVEGAYQVFRLAESLVVFFTVSAVALTPRRTRILSFLAGVVLAWVSVSVVLTYFRVVPTAVFGMHLPADPSRSGPWCNYLTNLDGEGLGTIGYNHAYVGCQLVLLCALRLHLSGNAYTLANALLALLALAAVPLTTSRSAFASIIVFVAIYCLRSARGALAACAVLIPCMVIALLAWGISGLPGEHAATLERLATTFSFHHSENLAGRDEIWRSHLATFLADPSHWLFGAGLGSNADALLGRNAHMQPLQIAEEAGLVGLVIVTWFVFRLLRSLWRIEAGGRALFWGTSVLLVGSVSQETLYPVPAMVYFVSFYWFAVALGLRSAEGAAATSPRRAEW